MESRRRHLGVPVRTKGKNSIFGVSGGSLMAEMTYCGEADIQTRRLKEWENSVSTRGNNPDDPALVFFDISIDGRAVGRLVCELYDKEVPETCKNFMAMVSGEAEPLLIMKGDGNTDILYLDYSENVSHRLFPQSGILFGQFEGHRNVAVGGGTLMDENFRYRHRERGTLSMASEGPNTSGSVFHLSFAACPWLDYHHVVFGRVIEGLAVLDQLEKVPINRSAKPMAQVQITLCGRLNGDRVKTKPPMPEMQCSVVSDCESKPAFDSWSTTLNLDNIDTSKSNKSFEIDGSSKVSFPCLCLRSMHQRKTLENHCFSFNFCAGW